MSLGNKNRTIRMCIAGSGFSGAILARQLLRYGANIEVIIFEKNIKNSLRKHWTQPVTGAGLNINPNAMATLKQIDLPLYQKIRAISLPRKSVTAVTTTGEQLYQFDVIDEKLADTYGCRVRWDDVNSLIRSYLADVIIYDTEVTGYSVEKNSQVTVQLAHGDGSTSTQGGFDLLVGADGRYSKVRTAVTGLPETHYGDVCNFRILLPNCQLNGKPFSAVYGKTGLFDDLQLVYNDKPSVKHLAKDSPLHQDKAFTDCVLRSSARVGIMRVPASKLSQHIGESLYLFGNFAIPKGQEIPESVKTAEALSCLFTPASGDTSMTAEAKFIRAAITENIDNMHWARFQDIPVVFHDQSKKVLLLGDAAHGFCPSLGQGATLAIEDACLAAQLLLSAISNEQALSTAVEQLSLCQTDRVSMIRDMSNEAGQHIKFSQGASNGQSALSLDRAAWCDENSASKWRSKVRQMWQGYPNLSVLDGKTWLQALLEKYSTEHYQIEFDKFLSSHLLSGAVALEQLGASRERVQKFVQQYSAKLVSSVVMDRQAPDAQPIKNNVMLLGQRKHYEQIRGFYQNILEELNGDIAQLVRQCFPPLSAGIAASLFHSGINLGYAVFSGSKHSVVEALAYLHHSHKPIIFSQSKPSNHISYFGQGELSFVQVLAVIEQDKAGLETLQKSAELSMRTKQYGWYSSTPQYRIAAMLAQGNRLIDYVNLIHIDELFAKNIIDIDLNALNSWLLDQAIALYARCENKNEFVVLHCVTAAWSFCQFSPLLAPADLLIAARSLLSTFLAAYAVQGCPVIQALPDIKSVLSLDDWQLIAEQALARDMDEHVYKLVAVCKDRWFQLSNKMSSQAKLCELAAKIALDNDIYWHQYELPEGLPQDAIGVSGIRNNHF